MAGNNPEPSKDVAVEPYLLTPVALSEYQYWKLHPNHFKYQTSLLAFPGAEGFGKYTTGGRGGVIYHVTNRNDSGPGSLRAGIDMTVPRVIVFDVGGDWFPVTSYRISESAGEDDLTIAGETAPSPGVTIRGKNLNSSQYGGVIDISASNVIIRYITVRDLNDALVSTDCIRLKNDTSGLIEDIIIDHVSASHGDDETISMNDVTNSTISHCLLSDPRSVGSWLYGNQNFNNTYIYNYTAHSGFRNMIVGYGTNNETSEWINNIIYGYEEGHYVVYGNIHDALGNIYKGFSNNAPDYRTISWNRNDFNNPDGVITDGSFYFADNIGLNLSLPLYNDFAITYNSATRQITNSLVTTWLTDQTDIENKVLAAPGNSIHQDSYDAAKIASYYSNTGDFNLDAIPNKTGTSKSAGFDSDNDDLDDVAEIAIWGDITTTNSAWAYTDGVNITGYDAWPNHDKMRWYYASDPLTGGGGSPTPSTPSLKKNFFNKLKGFF